jgi:hypothetical protein
MQSVGSYYIAMSVGVFAPNSSTVPTVPEEMRLRMDPVHSKQYT